MESLAGVWNGDVDLGDGKLEELRREYDQRVTLVSNIAGIDNLTDAELGRLAENMPLLREIDASWNSSLSDTGISALLRCCNKLKKVVLCGLKLITSQPFLGIIGDLKRWQLLEELWWYGKRRQTSSSQGKVALKTCDSVSSELQEWQLSGQLPNISYLDINFDIV